ncbi:hypothetical protein ACNKHO_17075 [Shigella flexneri]
MCGGHTPAIFDSASTNCCRRIEVIHGPGCRVRAADRTYR